MKFYTIAFICTLAAASVFAQENLREAIDAGDVALAQKMVKKGEVEEIYCGKLSAEEAVKVYDKIFKAMPDESFANCPSQFAYGYGTKVCSNAKAMNACTEVIAYLLLEGENGNTKAIDVLENVAKAALKTKAFAKPIKVPVDTSMWVSCPKKKGREACIEKCYGQAQEMGDSLKEESCKTNPEQFVDTIIKFSKPSPVYEKLRQGLLDGFWKTPKSNAKKYSVMQESAAKTLGIPDSLIVNLNYVSRWADLHKADSTPLPGSELFRFCTTWENSVDSILASKEFENRCPVFEIYEDVRDGQKYKVKEINGVHWFVENLNYNAGENSSCYDREDENCKIYGRLYTQDAALASCPEGTHLSSNDDWKMLEIYAGGANMAGEKLRSNGSDEYAFTALFAGYTNKNGISVIQGEGAYFWTNNDGGDGRGEARSMFSTDKEISSIFVDKKFRLSVRCIVDKVESAVENSEKLIPEENAAGLK